MGLRRRGRAPARRVARCRRGRQFKRPADGRLDAAAGVEAAYRCAGQRRLSGRCGRGTGGDRAPVAKLVGVRGGAALPVRQSGSGGRAGRRHAAAGALRSGRLSGRRPHQHRAPAGRFRHRDHPQPVRARLRRPVRAHVRRHRRRAVVPPLRRGLGDRRGPQLGAPARLRPAVRLPGLRRGDRPSQPVLPAGPPPDAGGGARRPVSGRRLRRDGRRLAPLRQRHSAGWVFHRHRCHAG